MAAGSGVLLYPAEKLRENLGKYWSGTKYELICNKLYKTIIIVFLVRILCVHILCTRTTFGKASKENLTVQINK